MRTKRFIAWLLAAMLAVSARGQVGGHYVGPVETSAFARQLLVCDTAAAMLLQLQYGSNFFLGQLAVLNGTNTWSGTNSFTNSGNVFVGNGSGLVNNSGSAFAPTNNPTIYNPTLLTSTGSIVYANNGANVLDDINDDAFFAHNVTAANGFIGGTFTGTTFTGNGHGLTNLNPASIAAGTASNALSLTNMANVLAGNGAAITNLTPGALASGPVSNALSLTNTANVLAGNGQNINNISPAAFRNGTVSNSISFTNVNNVFAGNGNGLTSLNPANMNAGTWAGGSISASGNTVAANVLSAQTTCTAELFAGSGSLFSITAATNSGSGATISTDGTANNAGFTVTMTTGTGVSTGAVFSIVFGPGYTAAPHIGMCPMGPNAIVSTNQIYCSSITSSGLTMSTGATPLAPSTQYKWSFTLIQ